MKWEPSCAGGSVRPWVRPAGSPAGMRPGSAGFTAGLPAVRVPVLPLLVESRVVVAVAGLRCQTAAWLPSQEPETFSCEVVMSELP